MYNLRTSNVWYRWFFLCSVRSSCDEIYLGVLLRQRISIIYDTRIIRVLVVLNVFIDHVRKIERTAYMWKRQNARQMCRFDRNWCLGTQFYASIWTPPYLTLHPTHPIPPPPQLRLGDADFFFGYLPQKGKARAGAMWKWRPTQLWGRSTCMAAAEPRTGSSVSFFFFFLSFCQFVGLFLFLPVGLLFMSV